MTARITRVGIVAKHGLLAASEHLARLGAWLRERRIEAVYETETARSRGDRRHSATRVTRGAARRASI